jgi:hypothetical protein
MGALPGSHGRPTVLIGRDGEVVLAEMGYQKVCVRMSTPIACPHQNEFCMRITLTLRCFYCCRARARRPIGVACEREGEGEGEGAGAL